MKKTFDEKLFLVKQLKDGAPITRLAREYHVRQPTLLQWARKYDRYGVDGLRPLRRPRMRIPKEIKEEIMRLYFEESIPLQWLVVTTRFSDSTLKRWVKAAEKSGRWVDHGGHGRGRPSNDVMLHTLLWQSTDLPEEPPKETTIKLIEKRPPKAMRRQKVKISQTEVDQLRSENLRLRAENALLKKVHALVLEKKTKQHNGQKPSTN